MSVIRRGSSLCGSGRRNERRHLRQVPEIGHQLPDLPVGQIPGRHARVTDAVANMIKKLPVGSRLNRKGAKCRRARILVAADGGLAASVISVTGLAFVAVKLSPRRDACRIVLQRTGACPEWIDASLGKI